MRRYYRPLIVVFSSLALASLFSYAAVKLTELSAKETPARAEASAADNKEQLRKTFAESSARAAAGDVHAMLELGMAYTVGLGTPIDRASAVKWLRLAAEKGHERAQFIFGQMCLRGELLPKDPQEAVRWFRLSAAQGNADAELSLAQAYESGEGVMPDEKEYLRWLKLAATHGHPLAQAEYGASLYDEAKPELWEESAGWIRKAAMQGHPRAMFDMGALHLNGQGVRKDQRVALAWFMLASSDADEEMRERLGDMIGQATDADRRAANKLSKEIVDKMEVSPIFGLGSRINERAANFHRQFELARNGKAEDQYELARLYHEGIGTVKDPAEAAVWCRKAAEQGHVDAMRTLAATLEDGDGVKQDFVEMVKWYRQAAEKDDPQSQFKLGVCYIEGNGVEKDERQAELWTKKAADHGHPIAQANMGSFILFGPDKSRFPEAVRWFKLSAKQGHPKGMFKYGLMLFLGTGVTKDRVEGAAWMIACLPRADESLKHTVKESIGHLTPEERTKAEAAAIEIQKTL